MRLAKYTDPENQTTKNGIQKKKRWMIVPEVGHNCIFFPFFTAIYFSSLKYCTARTHPQWHGCEISIVYRCQSIQQFASVLYESQ